ncbi:hypothetical protein [Flavobacterium sp. UBA4854]|uniref:hypothetical protein n=1 Tax=Flavobacterium sp. UBA4854 TaxID=1946548 RepID=UPI00257AF326|nr:hypothetical protein [Flavobacterium sp. UBA4854]
MKFAKFLFIAFFVISCSNEDSTENNSENKSLVTELNANVFNSGLASSSKFTFEYDSNQRLTKKSGGYIPRSTSTGLGDFFTSEVYTSFTYNNNSVVIENFSNHPDFTIAKDTRILTLNASNQIETKEIPNLLNTYNSKKQNFTYSQNKLVKIVTTYPNMPYDATDPADYILSYTENFYYDAKGNLTKSEYFEQHNGVNKGEKTIRTFEDYDSSENPCKDLQFVDEFFYRSLSKNNFKKYTISQYNNNVLSLESTSTWTFIYDSNGQLIIK